MEDPRSARHLKDNPEEYVKKITEFAFKATTERARMEALADLDGVRWGLAAAVINGKIYTVGGLWAGPAWLYLSACEDSLWFNFFEPFS